MKMREMKRVAVNAGSLRTAETARTIAAPALTVLKGAENSSGKWSTEYNDAD